MNLGAVLAQGAAPTGGDDHTVLLLGLLCLAVAAILLVIEMFVPASGTMALLAAVTLVTGIVLLVSGGGTIGRVTAVIALIASPFALMALLWLWPQTPIARLITLQNRGEGAEEEADAGPPGAPAPGSPGTPGSPAPGGAPGGAPGSAPGGGVAIGARGMALTDLRPIGTCQFGRQRIECLAEGGLIDAGSSVVVVALDGIVTKVRPGGG
jgi:membrane-bound ClpP family serine protease